MKSKKQNAKTPLAQFVAIIALTISIFLVIDLGRRAAANYRVQREAERLSQEVELARQEQQELQARLEYIATDLYVEEIARSELKWARPGETVVVILPTSEANPQAPTQKPQTVIIGPVARTPAQAWRILFFGPNAVPRYTKELP